MPDAAVKIGQRPPGLEAHAPAAASVSLQSRAGLNAANFFLAEITGVVMPFLGAYLQGRSLTAIGGVLGPLGAGFLAEHLGYNGFFYVFAGIAVVAALLFLCLMPETRPSAPAESPSELGRVTAEGA